MKNQKQPSVSKNVSTMYYQPTDEAKRERQNMQKSLKEHGLAPDYKVIIDKNGEPAIRSTAKTLDQRLAEHSHRKYGTPIPQQPSQPREEEPCCQCRLV